MAAEILNALQEERAALAAKIREFADLAKNGEWSDETQANYDKCNVDYDAVVAKIAEENKAAERAAEIAARADEVDKWENTSRRPNSRIGRDGARLDDRDVTNGPSDEDKALALQGWMRAPFGNRYGALTERHVNAMRKCGVEPTSAEFVLNLGPYRRDIRNALSTQDGPSGGYTIGETLVTSLEMAMLAYGSVAQAAEVIRTATAEPLRWPTANDTSNTGEQLGESVSIGSSVEPTFASVIWNAYKFSSKPILVPFEFLRDNVVNFGSVIGGMLGERLGRIQNTKFTTGSGAATPKGIVTCSSLGVTAASATAIAFDELIDLEHSLDPSRRMLPGVGYMFHDSILKALRKLKDGEGQYLWQSGANTGAPDTLNRYPYFINQDMQSSVATATKTVLFGQLSAYKIRQVGDIRLYRLEERYRDLDQTGFVAFIESDGNLLNAGDNPVKHLLQA